MIRSRPRRQPRGSRPASLTAVKSSAKKIMGDTLSVLATRSKVIALMPWRPVSMRDSCECESPTASPNCVIVNFLARRTCLMRSPMSCRLPWPPPSRGSSPERSTPAPRLLRGVSLVLFPTTHQVLSSQRSRLAYTRFPGEMQPNSERHLSFGAAKRREMACLPGRLGLRRSACAPYFAVPSVHICALLQLTAQRGGGMLS